MVLRQKIILVLKFFAEIHTTVSAGSRPTTGPGVAFFMRSSLSAGGFFVRANLVPVAFLCAQVRYKVAFFG